MAEMYYDDDADLELLNGKKIAVIGFGSQGHAHALNLRDSGADVIVGLYPGSRSWNKVQDSGLAVDTVADAAAAADIVMVLTPDHVQKQIYDQHIAPSMTEGKTLMFAHGFAIHYNQVQAPPEVDVSMIAPKGPGHLVRRVFEEGGACRRCWRFIRMRRRRPRTWLWRMRRASGVRGPGCWRRRF